MAAAATQVSTTIDINNKSEDQSEAPATREAELSTYDTRAFGDFGWAFVNAGEQYRKLKKVSKEDALMMCGIFKQATMGDCLVEEPKRNDQEIRQREEWLKHKGMDHIDAMQLYIDKVKELAQVYETKDNDEAQENSKADKSK